jgi:hypothetical protein
VATTSTLGQWTPYVSLLLLTNSFSWSQPSKKELKTRRIREFVLFYKELSGTPKLTLPPSAEVVQCGPCITTSSHGFLLALVSADDIKQAFFSMGDDKAPGLDGYTSAFFKKS